MQGLGGSFGHLGSCLVHLGDHFELLGDHLGPSKDILSLWDIIWGTSLEVSRWSIGASGWSLEDNLRPLGGHKWPEEVPFRLWKVTGGLWEVTWGHWEVTWGLFGASLGKLRLHGGHLGPLSSH